jgi:signal transduction histidine kinase
MSVYKRSATRKANQRHRRRLQGFTDNGPGIPADRADDVFLPHYTTRPGAAGMGLTIIREVCRAHGGEATVLPRAGQGTTVRVTLKRKQPRATLPNGS